MPHVNYIAIGLCVLLVGCDLLGIGGKDEKVTIPQCTQSDPSFDQMSGQIIFLAGRNPLVLDLDTDTIRAFPDKLTEESFIKDMDWRTGTDSLFYTPFDVKEGETLLYLYEWDRRYRTSLLTKKEGKIWTDRLVDPFISPDGENLVFRKRVEFGNYPTMILHLPTMDITEFTPDTVSSAYAAHGWKSNTQITGTATRSDSNGDKQKQVVIHNINGNLIEVLHIDDRNSYNPLYSHDRKN